jgi:excisionase family DNA binding protein
MNKKDACEFLGVSERSLARYAAQGKIQVIYCKGQRGKVADYEESDLQRLKEEIGQPVMLRPRRADLPVSDLHARADSHAIAPVSGAGSIPDLLTLIAERLQPSSRPVVAVENKLTLSLAEASALAGLSRSILVEAIHAKKLKGAKRGRGWNIKRADLDEYIKKL